MAASFRALVNKTTRFFTANGLSSSSNHDGTTTTTTITQSTDLFPSINDDVNGNRPADCDLVCSSCTIEYPARFDVDHTDKLYGCINGWATHVLVATGKTDWKRDIEDERGSVMEAFGKAAVKPANGVCFLLFSFSTYSFRRLAITHQYIYVYTY